MHRQPVGIGSSHSVSRCVVDERCVARIPFQSAPIIRDAEPERLKSLFELGATYHVAASRLIAGRSQAGAAIQDAKAASTATQRLEAAAAMLMASSSLEQTRAELMSLPGLERVVATVDALAAALSSWVKSELGADGDWLAPVSLAHDCIRMLTPREPWPSLAWQQRQLVVGGRHAGVTATDSDRVQLDTWEADDPRAPGALGIENLVALTPPWSTVAWGAWRAAHRCESWTAAWDLWTPLEQYADKLVGDASGVRSAAAVGQTRRRSTQHWGR